MQKSITFLFVLGFVISTAILPNALSPQPAQAATLEEIGKAIGVWQRFMQDLQKTMNEPRQPKSQPAPAIQPEAPTAPPSSDDTGGEPEATE